MPPNRNPRRKNTSPLTAFAAAAATADPMADCVLPLDVIPCILTRLPLKSVLRFKSVCKPWCKLVASSKFVKAHHDQLSKDPQNQAAVIYSRSDYHDHTMSLYKINSGEKNPISLDHPYPGIFFRKDFLDASYGLMCRGCPPRGQGTVLWNPIFFRVDFVGACYGLLCMGCPPLGQGIVLWNPAMKLFKFVGPSKVEFEVPEMVSLGFGFDSKSDDFKVVRIVCLAEKKKGKSMGVGVEVYSANSDSWKTIEVGFRFKVLSTKNDAIVNGNPYWVVKFDEKGGAESSLGEALVCFDSLM
ncbi:Unknown protein [Striga hermonthica]|uniref:F-box domain-containing protein n=1 Tax=Striga hermonthica TaxID=68872 RepID=A0A9N7N4C7_STRHE|nr:Unknown protein [Striga hermonthica]